MVTKGGNSGQEREIRTLGITYTGFPGGSVVENLLANLGCAGSVSESLCCIPEANTTL